MFFSSSWSRSACNSSSLLNPRWGNCGDSDWTIRLRIMKRLPRFSRQFTCWYWRLTFSERAVRESSIPNLRVSAVLPVPMSPVTRTLGLVLPGLFTTERKSSDRNLSWLSRQGSCCGMYSRLRGCSSLKIVGRLMASRTMSLGERLKGSSLLEEVFSFKGDYFRSVNLRVILCGFI